MENSKFAKNVMEILPTMTISMGLMKQVYVEDKKFLEPISVSLYPYKISRTTYLQMKQLHTIWQKLLVKVAADKQFIEQLLNKFCIGDQYLEKILAIYKRHGSPKTGVVFSRIDYMGDSNPILTEYNLIAVGFNGMIDKVQNLFNLIKDPNTNENQETYPFTNNQQNVCSTLFQALQISDKKSGIILMIVHQEQSNYSDLGEFQRGMFRYGRLTKAATMNELIRNLKLDEETNQAYYDDNPIDAFYFFSIYKNGHYKTEEYWQVHEKIQKSNSIKIPSVQMILVNCKRVQTQLAKQKVLERYLSKQQAKQILAVTGQLYDFDDKNENQVQQLLEKASTSNYVLKPNIEGGHNSSFGIDAYNKMKQLIEAKKNLSHYSLMRLIQPEYQQNYFIHHQRQPKFEETYSETCTYGALIYRGDEIIVNKYGGIASRLKRKCDFEGGLSDNTGALAGVCVCNQK